MKHLKLEEKVCEARHMDHLPHDWWQGLNRWGAYRQIAGANVGMYSSDLHWWCPGLETRGRHKGKRNVELDSQTNRPEDYDIRQMNR